VPVQNVLYAQSGGVTATINASACGVIETARRNRERIGRVYAACNGILGALHEDLIDTSAETANTIRALLHTPGGAFGSCRYDLPALPQGRAHFERLTAVFRAHNIGYFFYNGGNGSAETAHQVATILPRLGWPVKSIAVPKTIDNDILRSDSSPGFGSAAKYVATSMHEAMTDLASMANSSTKVFVMEVMGTIAGAGFTRVALLAEQPQAQRPAASPPAGRPATQPARPAAPPAAPNRPAQPPR
jgi:6-phosphofructokinase 1